MNVKGTARLAGLLVLCLLALPLSLRGAQPPGFKALYSFGDSLSDTGNVLALTAALGQVPAAPPSEHPYATYYRGHFSNGPIAVEYLWELISGEEPGTQNGLRAFLAGGAAGTTRAVDFAFGGTGTPSLDQTPGGLWAPGLEGQIELFRLALHGRRNLSRSLFVIATGSNDYRDDPFNVPMDPTEVVGNIVDGIETLYDLGARHVMVYDLPDPAFLPAGDPTGLGSQLAAFHNALLAQGIAGLSAAHPDLEIVPVHVNALFPQIEQLGFEMRVPALDALFPGPWMPGDVPPSLCLFVAPAACRDVDFDVFEQLGRRHTYWDIVHPTTDAHRILGEYLYGLLFG